MARGRKPNPVNYQEEIERVDLRIVHHQNSIKELEEKREYLIEQKKQRDVNVIMMYLNENNLSAEDLIEQLDIYGSERGE